VDARRKESALFERYPKPGAAAASHFVTAEPASIAALTRAAGFRYAWDEPTQHVRAPDRHRRRHADGRFARYLFGIEYGPRDLRLALVEASEGKSATRRHAASLLLPLRPMTGRYARHHADAANRRRVDSGSRSARSSSSCFGAKSADRCASHVVRHAALPGAASTMAGRVDTLYSSDSR